MQWLTSDVQVWQLVVVVVWLVGMMVIGWKQDAEARRVQEIWFNAKLKDKASKVDIE